MDDTDKPDPALKQVPLIKNPLYQPPKPITLNTNYNKLLPNLFKTVIPPKLNLSKDDLKKWMEEIKLLKRNDNEDDIKKFDEWLRSKQLQIAPGFESFDEIMTPSKIENKIENENDEKKDTDQVNEDINELDKVFGKTTI